MSTSSSGPQVSMGVPQPAGFVHVGGESAQDHLLGMGRLGVGAGKAAAELLIDRRQLHQVKRVEADLGMSKLILVFGSCSVMAFFNASDGSIAPPSMRARQRGCGQLASHRRRRSRGRQRCEDLTTVGVHGRRHPRLTFASGHGRRGTSAPCDSAAQRFQATHLQVIDVHRPPPTAWLAATSVTATGVDHRTQQRGLQTGRASRLGRQLRRTA
jgi:hypothetical protein